MKIILKVFILKAFSVMVSSSSTTLIHCFQHLSNRRVFNVFPERFIVTSTSSCKEGARLLVSCLWWPLVGQHERKTNWKKFFFVLSRTKNQEGKESTPLNYLLEISIISQENMQIHSVFLIFTWLSLKSQNILSRYL